MVTSDTLIDALVLATQLHHRQIASLRQRPGARWEARIHLSPASHITGLLTHRYHHSTQQSLHSDFRFSDPVSDVDSEFLINVSASIGAATLSTAAPIL